MVDPLGPKLSITNDRRVAAAARAAATPVVAQQTERASAPGSLAALAKQDAATPPVDMERVLRIRRAVSEGNFPISPATVADRLIALKLEWSPDDAA